MDIRRQEQEEFKPRHRYFVSAAVIIFLMIFIRLWYIQVIKGEELRLLSENNRIRLRKIPAVRGIIKDRMGRVVVDNRPSFNVMIMPEDVDDLTRLETKLSHILQLSTTEIEGKIKDKERPAFQPVKIKRDISWEELSLLKMNQLDLPGVEIGIEPIRIYPYGKTAAHVLGYVAEINKEELKQREGYSMGDLMGKCGIEWTWEDHLKGIDGGKQVEVDAVGKEVRVLNEATPVPGHNLCLTIDLDLQMYAEKLLGEKAGAIIAMDPSTGEILVLCSSPSFQPALFSEGIPDQEWVKLLSHPLHPMQNRGIQGLYPPGSVFKIVTASAGLEEGVIDPTSTLYCSGIYPLGKKGYRCWRAGGHGALRFYRAVVESCDIFFYQVGERLGVERLSAYANGFGFGRPTGIDLPGEKSGLVPTAQWKEEKLGEPWYAGETITMAIGQSYLLATPLQILTLISSIANGKVILKPLIVKRVEDADKKVVVEYHPQEIAKLPVSEKNVNEIQRALLGVVKDDNGTGKAARLAGVDVAGKTGTAQVVKLRETGMRMRPEEMRYELRDHAWFVAYAPASAPEIAVVVLIEHGGHGGSVAAPFAREMIQKYLDLKRGKR